jgi:hypothetical protein
MVSLIYSQTLSVLRPFFRWRDKSGFWVDVGILAAWIAIVCFQISNHVMWRDEVRALSIALAGDDLLAMLRGLHGEGHPALWYLLLREAYFVFGHVAALPGVAFAIAAGAVILLIFRSPFPRALVIVLVGSHCFLYEYSVMARNYGISALLLFMIATTYYVGRDRGVRLGVLLFLLANSNVIATIMVVAFLLFWLFDLIEENGFRWTPQLSNFVLNAAIAMIGIALCGLTILPTFNDAAVHDWSTSSPAIAALKAVLNPAGTTRGGLYGGPSAIGSLLLFGATVGLMPKRAAFLAALAGLLLFSLFSAVAAESSSRHAMVWLTFCITLYWICWRDVILAVADPSRASVPTLLFLAGRFMFLVILGSQFATGLLDIHSALFGRFVESKSADLGRLISARDDLTNAVIVSEPEFMVEALPYYAPNRVYFIREHRFGNVVRFSRSGKLETNLGEILQTSRELQQATGSPIVIVMAHRLKRIIPNRIYKEGYNWTFSASDAQIRAFLSATILIAEFGRTKTNETYDVYLLRRDGWQSQ